ncbi:MAG: acyl-CoA thioesterase [Cyclobacteriaceae bacterium]
MFQHEVQVRVRYADTDQMGYVYYGNYARYYEIARVEAFRAIGFSYKRLEDMGIGMPVMDMQTKYHAPAIYDDLLRIVVKIPEQPRARIAYHYEIFNEAEKLLNTGMTTLLFINLETGRPVRMPEELRQLVDPYYE